MLAENGETRLLESFYSLTLLDRLIVDGWLDEPSSDGPTDQNTQRPSLERRVTTLPWFRRCHRRRQAMVSRIISSSVNVGE
jgi:hypothetical protein